MLNITDADYDALFASMKRDMPRIWRDVFPVILAKLKENGAVAVKVTETHITVSSPRSQMSVYTVTRTPTLH